MWLLTDVNTETLMVLFHVKRDSHHLIIVKRYKSFIPFIIVLECNRKLRPSIVQNLVVFHRVKKCHFSINSYLLFVRHFGGGLMRWDGKCLVFTIFWALHFNGEISNCERWNTLNSYLLIKLALFERCRFEKKPDLFWDNEPHHTYDGSKTSQAFSKLLIKQ